MTGRGVPAAQPSAGLTFLRLLTAHLAASARKQTPELLDLSVCFCFLFINPSHSSLLCVHHLKNNSAKK